MVMPRSRSMSIEVEHLLDHVLRSATVPVCWINRSAESRFAVIDVGDDGEIADIVDVMAGHGRSDSSARALREERRRPARDNARQIASNDKKARADARFRARRDDALFLGEARLDFAHQLGRQLLRERPACIARPSSEGDAPLNREATHLRRDVDGLVEPRQRRDDSPESCRAGKRGRPWSAP